MGGYPSAKSSPMGVNVRYIVLCALVVAVLVPVVQGCGESAPMPASESVGPGDVPVATPVSAPVDMSALSPTPAAVPSAASASAMAVHDAS